jgi:hypothetical protein
MHGVLGDGDKTLSDLLVTAVHLIEVLFTALPADAFLQFPNSLLKVSDHFL